MTILSYSQNSYPRKLILESDTVIVISEPQLKKINEYLLRYEKLNLYNDSLISILNTQKTILDKRNVLNELLNKRNSDLLIQNADLIKLNSTNNKIQEYYKKELKVKNRKKTIAFFGGLTLGIATTSTLILILM